VTQDKKRKAAIRKAQQASGRRYAAVAREMSTFSPGSFQLRDLLAECASRPAVDLGWESLHPDFAPSVFESDLIGTAIPYGTVLQLAGLLARDGRAARLTVESVSPQESVVVTCTGRRIELMISQDSAWSL
jgi:hypothetical protein